MTSPCALEVERKGQHRLYSAMLVVGQALRVEPRQVALDLAAQSVEHIVLAARPGDGLAVPQAQRVGRRLDHRIEHVDHAQRFPGRMTDRDRRRLHRRIVKIERTPGVGGADAGRHRAFEQPREPRKQRQERQGDDEVERGVEVRHGAGEIGLYLDEFNADRRHERQGDRPADETGEEVSDHHAPSRRVPAPRAFEERIESGADVRADNQRQRRVERHDPLFSEGHDEQRHGDARTSGPGEQGSERHRDQAIGRNAAHEDAQARNIFVWRD